MTSANPLTAQLRSPVLSGGRLHHIWERALGKRGVDRAMAVLQEALPECQPTDLARLPLGRRDALLLALRESTISPQFRNVARCPQCRTMMGCLFTAAQIRFAVPPVTGAEQYALEHAGYSLLFRLLTSIDVATAPVELGVEEIRAHLVRRCVLQASHNGQPVKPDALPEPVVVLLAARLSELDPQSEVFLPMECSNCDLKWNAVFEIEQYFWDEIRARVEHILAEVHVLASAYGWSEHDIVAMTPAKRKYYLEAAGA